MKNNAIIGKSVPAFPQEEKKLCLLNDNIFCEKEPSKEVCAECNGRAGMGLKEEKVCPVCGGEVEMQQDKYFCANGNCGEVEPLEVLTEHEHDRLVNEAVEENIRENTVAQVRDELLEVGMDDLREITKQIDHQIGTERHEDMVGLSRTIPTSNDLNRKKKWAIEAIAECFGEYLHGTAEVSDCSEGANFTMMGDILGDLALYISNAE